MAKKIMFVSVLAEAVYKSRKELVEYFLNNNYEVIIIAPDKNVNIKSKFDSINVKYLTWDMKRTGLNIIKDYLSIRFLRNIIKSENPDIIYSFGGAKATVYGTLAAKNLVFRNFCMVNGLGSVFRGQGFRNTVLRFVMILLFRFSLKKSNLILFQNHDDLTYFINKRIINHERSAIVNGSGVNLDKFQLHPIVNKKVFLFVGRLLKDKGIYEFVDSAREVKKKYPDAQFWIVGGLDDNPTSINKNDLNKWISDGIIKYFGRVDDVSKYYKDCSVFVLPSYHEGTPRTNLEAMATGRPIITTDTAGCKETVIDGYNGFLVPIKNATEISKKIMIFLENETLISKMGQNSYVLAKKKYDVKIVNDTIIHEFMKE